jgi:hypothetical protein
LKEITDRAFLFVENRDKNGLMKHLDMHPSVPIIDMIDHRGYTLMHMVCFKNLEVMGLHLMEKVKQTITEK